MKNYGKYTVEDFINDEDFIRWVKFGDKHLHDFWTEFISQHPEKLPQIEEAKHFINLFGEQVRPLSSQTMDELLRHITDRIDMPVSAHEVHEIVESQSRKNRTYLYAAAVSIAVLAFASWWVMNPEPPSDTRFTVNQGHPKDADGDLREHATPNGRRSSLTLEDGTHIWLNAGSTLRYAKNYLTAATRDVYLQGEAFFDVVSDEAHPFIVHVEGVSVRALGTSFNVKGYREDAQVEATLVHGKISIEDDSLHNQITLVANQRAVLLKQRNGLMVENNIETESYTSWTKGVLVFEDQPLYEILPVLERTFNVAIHTDDASSLDCRFTAKVDNKSLREVLELFRTTDTIGYTIVGNQVYIKGDFCTD